MSSSERRQLRLRERGMAALRKIRSADRAEAGEEDRITKADLREALQESRQQPQSLPVRTIADVPAKAVDLGFKAARKLHPGWQVAIFLTVAFVALAAGLGWLDPPQRLPKQGVAPPTATT